MKWFFADKSCLCMIMKWFFLPYSVKARHWRWCYQIVHESTGILCWKK